MPKPRAKRPRRRPAAALAPNVASALVIFLASVAVFVHQCVLPVRSLTTFRAPARPPRPHDGPPAATRPHAAPRNWFQIPPRLAADPPAPAPQRESRPAAHADPAAHPVVTPRPTPVDALDAIPVGPLPLPPLARPNMSAPEPPSVHAGSSWTASLAQGFLSALPLHWVAEAAHAPPRKGAPRAEVGQEEHTSIFAARRKGAWIGCERPFHLVCKGVYRAIKKTNAVHVVDLSCDRNKAWLPHIVRKLEEEFRMVRLTCVGEGGRDDYRGVKGVQFLNMDPFSDRFPNGTDMLVAYRFLEKRTLIDAMRFFKNVKSSGTVKVLATETFPAAGNEGGRINTALAPFWFPVPVFQYENEEENTESVPMRITAVNVAEMFKERNTPEMKDLVDPRRRMVRE